MSNYLTVKQACECLGIKDTESVYRYIRTGKLRAYKLGGSNSNGHWRIKPEDLEAFVTGQVTVLNEQKPESKHTESN